MRSTTETYLDTRIKNAKEELDESLKEYEESQRKTVFMEKEIFLKQVFSDAESEINKYRSLARSITATAAAEMQGLKRDADKVIYPASMTKILTVLTASDYVKSLDDTFVINQDILDYVYIHKCSAVGWKLGDTVTVRDLFQGTMICSGADAALGLATYVAGSPEAFVDLMNDKAKEIGLSENAHFTNPVGIHDENLHCTVKDIAILLSVAIQNDICMEAMSTWTDIVATNTDAEYMENFNRTFEEVYDTASEDGINTELDYGIEINNWFLRRIKDYSTNGRVKCAKTGFVTESGNCCASYLMAKGGKHYICVTANGSTAWRVVFDHVGVYKAYTK